MKPLTTKKTIFVSAFVLFVLWVTFNFGASVERTRWETLPTPTPVVFGSFTCEEELDTFENLLVTEINDIRLGNGLKTLRPVPTLFRSAELKAKDILENQLFEHWDKNGKETWHFFCKGGYCNWTWAGENLAREQWSVEKIVEAWWNSPTHKGVLLAEEAEEIGTGIVCGEYGGILQPIIVMHVGKR